MGVLIFRVRGRVWEVLDVGCRVQRGFAFRIQVAQVLGLGGLGDLFAGAEQLWGSKGSRLQRGLFRLGSPLKFNASWPDVSP